MRREEERESITTLMTKDECAAREENYKEYEKDIHPMDSLYHIQREIERKKKKKKREGGKEAVKE